MTVDDGLAFYSNYSRQDHSNYDHEHCLNTNPENYNNIEHVKKGHGVETLGKLGCTGQSTKILKNIIPYPCDFQGNNRLDDITDMRKCNSMVLTDKERQEVKKRLMLPDDINIERKVPNPLYDIYYVPGYDKYSLNNCPDFQKSKDGSLKHN